VPGNGGCIAAGGGSVWVTMPDTPVTRIDLSTNGVVAQYKGAGGDCIGWWDDSLWLSNNREGTVWRLTP
jgi:virginiamycin B lyase